MGRINCFTHKIKEVRASFADSILPEGLARLIDLGEESHIAYCLRRGGEVGAICSQVGENWGPRLGE